MKNSVNSSKSFKSLWTNHLVIKGYDEIRPGVWKKRWVKVIYNDTPEWAVVTVGR